MKEVGASGQDINKFNVKKVINLNQNMSLIHVDFMSQSTFLRGLWNTQCVIHSV